MIEKQTPNRYYQTAVTTSQDVTESTLVATGTPITYDLPGTTAMSTATTPESIRRNTVDASGFQVTPGMLLAACCGAIGYFFFGPVGVFLGILLGALARVIVIAARTGSAA